MAIGIVVGAALTLAGTLTSAAIESGDIEEAQNEARRLANLKRDDDLRWQDIQDRLGRARIGLGKKELAFRKREAGELRKERGLERGMLAREKHEAKMMGLVNSNQVLRSNFLQMMQRPRRRTA